MGNEAYLLAGFCRVNATPEDSQPLAGYGNTAKRMSKNVLDDITATCIAITDKNNETVLLFTQDVICYPEKRYLNASKKVSEATGIPVSHIKFTSTHTHSAPDPFSGSNLECNERFYEDLCQKEIWAAKEALNDRVPAYIKFGETKTTGLNFIRHYTAEGGGVLGDNHDSRVIRGAKLNGHTAQIDESLLVLRFVRNGIENEVLNVNPQDKKDIIFVNWRAHGTKTGGMQKFDMSADFPYALRHFVEESTGQYCAYFQGCAGNVNPHSRLKKEKITANYMEYGIQIAADVVSVLHKLQNAAPGTITVQNKFIEYPINHENEDKLEFCKELYKKWEETNDRELITELGREKGIYSPYHAGAVLRHSKLPKTNDNAELGVIKIGNIALCYLPGEPFVDTGRNIRNASKMDFTVIMGYTNLNIGYIPTSDAFEYGCYEAEHSPVGKGAAELFQKEMIKMINKE